MSKFFNKKAGLLCVAFSMAMLSSNAFAMNKKSLHEEFEIRAARNTDPWSCVQRGDYDPETASVVIDAQTGDILHSENADEIRYPASLVKVMTTLLIFDAIEDNKVSLNDTFIVELSPDVLKTKNNSRSTWVEEGAELTVEQAILAITVASANNISVMIAELLEGSEEKFVKALNEKAKEIGLDNTVFKNSTGLPDKEQVTTANDMAKLAVYILQNYQDYYHFFSAETAEFGEWVGNKKKHNHNELVVNNKEIDGLKTGFICDAGYNLIASAKRDGQRVIGVVFGSRTPHQRNVKMEDLLETALNEQEVTTSIASVPIDKPTSAIN
jgi:D-alanyl-D-alanine carboxypeptidase